jgi:hypothetical protein
MSTHRHGVDVAGRSFDRRFNAVRTSLSRRTVSHLTFPVDLQEAEAGLKPYDQRSASHASSALRTDSGGFRTVRAAPQRSARTFA